MAKHLKGATAVETHSAILDLIRSSGVVSRIELADRSGLTGASISRIVKQLLTEGLIAEVGFGDRTGGKRRTLLQLNARSRHAVGVSLDFASITYLVTDLSGEVIARLDADGIGHEPPGEVITRIAAELAGLVESAGVDRSTLMGIGMAVAGRQDSAHHVLRSNPQADDWELFDIEETLSSATDLAVVVENDSTCAAIGEFWVGRIPASADFATVYMATGFGLGLVTNGDIYRGSSSNVGEIGHMVLDVHGPPCWCGSQGCLEMLAAPARIVERALEQPGLADELGLQGEPGTIRQDAERVARAAAADHEQALPVIEESAFYLSRALVSVTNLLDLDQIILAGPGFGAAGEIYLRRIWQDLERLSFVRAVHPTKVGLSKSSDISAALGAASLVLHSRLTPHQTSSRMALAAR
ncbi:Sugar kinase of the NBD/HSP70 family, may contain an N-terminal HTH domain [Friedmanniella luteola]|uniref:Sugar kinase of the NBD/HSP70 family, may contain an N-terminal HTH domain n=1 Tax=Friedmanniella luteola TaxID=546871 RepID=A0A1H1ZPJ8_9ACTN|nr:ROK family transcriptional regulator [Friedmanniella luteola]SDT35590.1 Sugar kinase of the NBD/HSP70 family, may contain an N-terminal HTH domain [Friedmanniella luteola]